MTPRVLVVEDTRASLELVAALLESEGCQVLKADPATAAIPEVALTAQAMQGEEERARENAETRHG